MTIPGPYVPLVPGGDAAAAGPPPVLLWARVYAGVLAVLYLAFAGYGVVLMAQSTTLPRAKSVEPLVTGVFCALSGAIFCVPSAVALFAGRARWVYTLYLVLIALGMTSCACLPFSVLLLVHWTKADVKSWYGAT